MLPVDKQILVRACWCGVLAKQTRTPTPERHRDAMGVAFRNERRRRAGGRFGRWELPRKTWTGKRGTPTGANPQKTSNRRRRDAKPERARNKPKAPEAKEKGGRAAKTNALMNVLAILAQALDSQN